MLRAFAVIVVLVGFLGGTASTGLSFGGERAAAAGVNQVSAPEWLPVRTSTGAPGGAELLVGCTYRSQLPVCGGHHQYWAIDMALGANRAPVFAAGAGRATLGWDASGWGNYVIVDHGAFGKTLYGHLAEASVAPGQWVDQNTQVGLVGTTGDTRGTPHLHFEYDDNVGGFGGGGSPNDPGELKACHGNTLVSYGSWEGLAWGSRSVHSDGTTCGLTVTDVATRYHPLVPARVLDSRPGPGNVGAYASPWGEGLAGSRDVAIAGIGEVPPDADAVVLNVTVVNATAGSYLQLWPTGSQRPRYGSSLNFSAGQIVPNAVTVKLGDGGRVRVLNAVGSTDVVIDVSGYYRAGPDGAGYRPLTPARVLDSRPGTSNVGSFAAPWGAGAEAARDVAIGGVGAVPAGASAVVLNVTVVNPSADSFLQLWPSGSGQPRFGSSLNFTAGQVVPNAVTVKLGAGGSVRVMNAQGSVDVVIDVSGYYTDDGGSAFHAVMPDRVLDSRPASNVGPFTTPWGWGLGGVRAVPIAGRSGVPGGATAVVLNVTAIEPSSSTFVQVWPTGALRPEASSNLNALAGEIVPNAVTAMLGYEGDVLVYNHAGEVDLVADVAGWFG